MAREKFLLVSLSESRTKELAQAVANETCRKILDYLADKEATESELAEKLNIPISTVHYNLQQLQKGGLVVSEEFHYSEKGKEVSHYKLANKYIIIAPKSTYGIKEKLKSILPVALIIAAGTGLIQLFSKTFGYGSVSKITTLTKVGAPSFAEAEEAIVDTAVSAAVQTATENITTITTITPPSLFSNIALWFFIGASVALIIYLIVDWIRKRK